MIGCGLACAGVLVVAVITIGVGYWLARTPPTDWAENQRMLKESDAATLDHEAQGLENRLTREVTSLRGEGGRSPRTRTIQVGLRQANAWLDRRLDDWAASQGIDLPKALDQMMLTTRGEDLVIAGQVSQGGMSQVVTALVDAHVREDGQLHIQLRSLKAGQLPVPVDFALSQSGLKKALPADALGLIQQAADEGLNLTPLWQIDQRRLRLLELKANKKSIALTIRTEPP